VDRRTAGGRHAARGQPVRQPLRGRGSHRIQTSRAAEFLAALAFERAWRAGDAEAAASFFADDARLVSQAPFPEHREIRGATAIRRFRRAYLGPGIAIDVTRKQIAGDRVTWSARWRADEAAAPACGEIQAEFRDEQVTHLALRPA
jgi:NTE family protein